MGKNIFASSQSQCKIHIDCNNVKHYAHGKREQSVDGVNVTEGVMHQPYDVYMTK